jgi:hypothetical protein
MAATSSGSEYLPVFVEMVEVAAFVLLGFGPVV